MSAVTETEPRIGRAAAAACRASRRRVTTRSHWHRAGSEALRRLAAGPDWAAGARGLGCCSPGSGLPSCGYRR